MVSLSRMLECGVVVNGLNAVDAETWKNYRAAARAAGVLVFNYDCPGLYGALDAHVDVRARCPSSCRRTASIWKCGATRRRTGTARC